MRAWAGKGARLEREEEGAEGTGASAVAGAGAGAEGWEKEGGSEKTREILRGVSVREGRRREEGELGR